MAKHSPFCRRVGTVLREAIYLAELAIGVVIAVTGLVLLLLMAAEFVQNKIEDLIGSPPADGSKPGAPAPAGHRGLGGGPRIQWTGATFGEEVRTEVIDSARSRPRTSA
jgi:hypothetical protein